MAGQSNHHHEHAEAYILEHYSTVRNIVLWFRMMTGRFVVGRNKEELHIPYYLFSSSFQDCGNSSIHYHGYLGEGHPSDAGCCYYMLG